MQYLTHTSDGHRHNSADFFSRKKSAATHWIGTIFPREMFSSWPNANATLNYQILHTIVNSQTSHILFVYKNISYRYLYYFTRVLFPAQYRRLTVRGLWIKCLIVRIEKFTTSVLQANGRHHLINCNHWNNYCIMYFFAKHVRHPNTSLDNSLGSNKLRICASSVINLHKFGSFDAVGYRTISKKICLFIICYKYILITEFKHLCLYDLLLKVLNNTSYIPT